MEDKIDFIITWVDGSDPIWQKEFEKYNSEEQTDANNTARFRDSETLKYVFRSIDKFAPWVNRVHFITAGHVPSWLDLSYKKLNFLTHKDIFLNKSHLPTFNSLAIEMNFLGIPNLAEKFVVFNDDMLILKPTSKDAFFKNGLPCDFLVENVVKGILAPRIYPNNYFVKSVFNTIAIINKNFDKKKSARNYHDKYINFAYGLKNNIKNFIASFSKGYIFFEHYHQPQPYLKTVWKKVYNVCEKDISLTSSHKFKSGSDIIHYPFRYWHLVGGNFYARFEDDFVTFDINSLSQARACIKAIQKKRFVCINDAPKLSGRQYEKCKKMILSSLDSVLPEKSGFEI